jgi:hypothetical protein
MVNITAGPNSLTGRILRLLEARPGLDRAEIISALVEEFNEQPPSISVTLQTLVRQQRVTRSDIQQTEFFEGAPRYYKVST